MLLGAQIAAAVSAASAQAPPSKPSAPTGFDPCTLMTKEEAATAVGEAVQQKPIRPGGSMPGVAVSACDYEAPSRSHVQVTVWRPFGDSAAMFLQVYKSGCLKKEQQPGLGDLACWYDKDHRELQVLKGSTLLTFEISRKGNATEALTTAAKKAVARVP
jgi:hypothetical protein